LILKEEVFPLILRACPSFQESWDKLDEEDRELLYVVMGNLAHHLLSLYLNKQTDEFGPLCEVVERLHIDGNDEVRELATIGFLEGVQNIWGENSKGFYEFLRPESRKWWKELEDFWSGNIPYVGAGLLAVGEVISLKGWVRTINGDWRKHD
jgi:hypothetical protein